MTMKHIRELMDLTGRVAIVTGGSGHIGFAIAQALYEAGATLALVDKSVQDLEHRAEALGGKANVGIYPVDLSVEEDTRALPPRVAERFGRIDVLVNCAAFVGTSDLEGWVVPFEKQKTAAWRAAFEVNVTAVFELVQAALPWLSISSKGSIINISSLYGEYGPDWRLYEGTAMGNPAAYGASKGALNQLTRWLASTLAPHVRCNAISPGGVARNQPIEFVKRYVEKTPLKRMACEEDFKGAALFLASDMACYVTGQILAVDGGWGIW